MFKFAFAAGLIIMMATSPLAARAETGQTVKPAGTHHASHHARAHRPTGSFNSEMRRRNNMARERARASAEHMRTMRNQ